MQFRVWRASSSARMSVRALSIRTTWKCAGHRRRRCVTPVQIELYGFMRSPVALRGSSCSKTSRSWKRRNDLVDAGNGDQRLGQGQAHAAVAFALDDADAAGFGDQKVRAADRRFNAQEFFAQKPPRRVGEVLRCAAQIGQVHLALENLADLARGSCAARARRCAMAGRGQAG